MNPCELTAAITALSITLAQNLTNEQISLLGTILTQISSTLFTISTQRSICCPSSDSSSSTPATPPPEA